MAESPRGQRHDRTALILYGSETGNSQDVAEELGRVTERLLFRTRVTEMDLVEINELLKYAVVIFAISTTGQGEFPKNSQKLWKSLLRKRLPPGCLSHVSFTTFGLGDSSYPRFNWSARKLHKRLQQLGAQEVYPRGEGDERHDEGIEGTFLPWSSDLRKHLLSSYPLPDGVSPLAPDAILPFKYRLVLVDERKGSSALFHHGPDIRRADNLVAKPDPATGSIDSIDPEFSSSALMFGPNARNTNGSNTADVLLPSIESNATPAPNATIGDAKAPDTVAPGSVTSGLAYETSTDKEGNEVFAVVQQGSDNGTAMDDQLKDDLIAFMPPHDKPAAGPGPEWQVNPPYLRNETSKFPPVDCLPIPNCRDIQLVKNERITPSTHWQDVRKLTFAMEVKDQSLRNKKSRTEKNVLKEQEQWKKWERGETSEARKREIEDYKKEYEIETGQEYRPDEHNDMEDYDKEYHPGDILTIYPKNFPEEVDWLIKRMGWDHIADRAAAFEEDVYADNSTCIPSNLYPPENMTLRSLLLHNLNINAIPDRNFFNVISQYTDDPMAKERLLEYGNPAFIDQYYDYATRCRRSIIEVFQEFGSVNIPWKYAASIFPIIRGRQFSIASGGALYYSGSKINIELIVAIVNYKTILFKPRHGLCSRYLASLPAGTVIRVQFEPKERFYAMAKEHPELPIIMIAPGTGVAPCRALVWERAEERMKTAKSMFEQELDIRRKKLHTGVYSDSRRFLISHKNGGIEPHNWAYSKEDWPLMNLAENGGHDPPQKSIFGQIVLFFGNRNRNADNFFSSEWGQKPEVQVFTAFSRDQVEKIYVQDIIRQQGQLIHDLMTKGAIVYVCGSSGSMPKAVKAALVDVLLQYGDHDTREGAEDYLARLERMGRYIQETW